MSTDTTVSITITFATAGAVPHLEQLAGEHGCNGLEKALKLYTTKSITNMHAFDENEKLVKFANVQEILTHFERVRLETYKLRKSCQLALLQKDANVLENKARFIAAILDNQLDLRKKTTVDVNALLKSANYLALDDTEPFRYLVHMPMNSVTQDNVDKLLAEKSAKIAEVDALQGLNEQQLWLQELQALRAQYVKKNAVKKASVVAVVGAGVKRKIKSSAKV